MARVIADPSIRGGWFAHSFQPPQLAGIFLAKLTCRLQPDQVAELLVEEGVSELHGDVPHAEDPSQPPQLSSDFAPFKPRFDLLLQATTYSPGGRPQPQWQASWSVGQWVKTIHVSGDRAWLLEPLGMRIGAPAPLEKLPLEYRYCFGGPGYARNPVGCGSGWQAQRLPNLELPQERVKLPSDHLEPAGVGPVDASWPSRQKYLGTYDRHWQRQRWPWFPTDFDYAFFNAAPSDQQLEQSLRGDEELRFEHLHPQHPQYRSWLPGVRVRCFISDSSQDADELTMADFREVPLQFDTLQIDMHHEQATLLFRGQAPVRSLKLDEVQTVFMMTEAVNRAPLSADQCLAHFRYLLHVDDEPPVDPQAQAAEEAAQQEFDAEMEQLEQQHAQAMAEAAELEAAARKRAAAAGVDWARAESGPPAGLAEMRAELMTMAHSLRAAQPQRALELEAQAAAIDELAKLQAEMGADETPPLTREDVQRMAAAGESFQGRSLVDLELYDLQLSGLDFSEADFSECMLDGANLSGSNLSNANFTEADLTDANLANANLTNANLSMADLTGANLAGACLDHASFSEAIVADCNFSQVSLNATILSELEMPGACFRGARGRGADFSQSKLAAADFSQSELPQTDFSGAVLSRARFVAAKLAEANFEEAIADGVSMHQAVLTGLHASDGADFHGGDFRLCTAEGAVWERSNLEGCDFSSACLRRGIFTAARLAACRLDRSDLSDSVLDDADLTRASLDQTNLLRASLDRAQLTQASLREANIYAAGLWNTNLTEIDRRGTNTKGTALSDE